MYSCIVCVIALEIIIIASVVFFTMALYAAFKGLLRVISEFVCYTHNDKLEWGHQILQTETSNKNENSQPHVQTRDNTKKGLINYA